MTDQRTPAPIGPFSERKCTNCNGQGYLSDSIYDDPVSPDPHCPDYDCSVCNGTGWIDGDEGDFDAATLGADLSPGYSNPPRGQTCQDCDGTGFALLGGHGDVSDCPKCNGRGWIETEESDE